MSPYIQSLRLRTLPLSMSGIILGAGLAWHHFAWSISCWDVLVFVFSICTTLSLQILSNLSNELGDAQKGTDTEQNERVAYGLQAGTITMKQIKGMIWLFVGLCILFGTALIYCAFGNLFAAQSLVFFGLGALAMIGSVTYTLGKHSYGYMGLGDLGVFIFFGLLSTMGAYYLQAQTMSWEVFACAVAIAMPIVGVLNLNNIRDMANDRAHGKRTFASWLGPIGGRVYHTAMLIVCLVLFAAFGHYWALCITPIWGWHVWYIWTHNEKLDIQMPVLMFTSLIIAVLAIF